MLAAASVLQLPSGGLSAAAVPAQLVLSTARWPESVTGQQQGAADTGNVGYRSEVRAEPGTDRAVHQLICTAAKQPTQLMQVAEADTAASLL